MEASTSTVPPRRQRRRPASPALALALSLAAALALVVAVAPAAAHLRAAAPKAGGGDDDADAASSPGGSGRLLAAALDPRTVDVRPIAPLPSEEEEDAVPPFDDFVSSSPLFDFESAAAASDSCLRAIKNPPSSYLPLEPPYINLGFPKMGTTSLHKFFTCGKVRSSHWVCGGKGLDPSNFPEHVTPVRWMRCAQCIRESVAMGMKPFDRCPKHALAWTQMDGTYLVRGPDGEEYRQMYFPQIELLEEIVAAYPKATYFLTFRSMERWYRSLVAWDHDPRKPGQHGLSYMQDIKEMDVTGSPGLDTEGNVEEFAAWFCRHVTRVREVIGRYPDASLVEVDIEDEDTPWRMRELFGFKETCWKHVNANKDLLADQE